MNQTTNELRALIEAARNVHTKLAHPTKIVTALDMWKLGDALEAYDAAQGRHEQAQGGMADEIRAERTAREAAEAAVARMREEVERLATRYDRIAAEHQHNADLVGEASSTYRIHLNLAGGYRERAADVRALLEGGAG